jgi:hypothetical protein
MGYHVKTMDFSPGSKFLTYMRESAMDDHRAAMDSHQPSMDERQKFNNWLNHQAEPKRR